MQGKGFVLLLKLHCILSSVYALQREDLFPFGPHRRDLLLGEGDDETSQVIKLKRPLIFYDTQFRNLYVGTNGIISTQDFPMETQYVDDGFPTDFPVIAAYLSDIDTSHGRGRIFYREDNSPDILYRAAQEIRRGFPRSAFSPSNAFIATWENVAPYEEVTRFSPSSNRFNTFQAVLAFDESNTYAIFLYPEDGLQFFGTRPKESYNVQIELPARVGFSRGETEYIQWKRDEPYYSLTSNEQSVKNLYQMGNSGTQGVWIFHIGGASQFNNVIQAQAGGKPSREAIVTLDSTLNGPVKPYLPVSEYSEADDYDEGFDEEDDETLDFSPLAPTDPRERIYGIPEQPPYPEAGIIPPHPEGYPEAGVVSSYPKARGLPSYPSSNPRRYGEADARQSYPNPGATHRERYPETHRERLPEIHRERLPETHTERLPETHRERLPETHRERHPETHRERHPETHRERHPETHRERLPETHRERHPETHRERHPETHRERHPETHRERHPETHTERHPETHRERHRETHRERLPETHRERHPETHRERYPNPAATHHERHPETHRERHPESESLLGNPLPAAPDRRVVSVEEEEELGTGVFTYSTDPRETCERNQGQCSQYAYCADYSSGFCCHCHSGYYGNGRQCLVEGATQRVNGKVNVKIVVGASRSPVEIRNADMHAYVVVSDGRAYTTISHIPESVGWALQPLSVIGGLFGWLFALQQPGFKNGFRITGAKFIRNVDITFYPGNERLNIIQVAQGLDTQSYLNVITEIEGHLPVIPYGASVQIQPYRDVYHHSNSVLTSTAKREYSVLSSNGETQTLRYDLRQNITFHDCERTSRTFATTQQLNVARVFVLYDQKEKAVRYAMTNEIGSVEDHLEPEPVNPCYDGSHDCDVNAQCSPGAERAYLCRCAEGYQGDGKVCTDIDECADGVYPRCGSHAGCVNLPGLYRCECHHGYKLAEDGRTCVLVDKCTEGRCHPAATCYNIPGSFVCQCNPGYEGDGLQCRPGRPKTKCEQERDQMQTGFSPRGPRPHPGRYVPQCDEEGKFTPRQCHQSVGQCWCVDAWGREIDGTKTSHGSNAPQCGLPVIPDREKTACEHQRERLQAEYSSRGDRPHFTIHIPQCDEHGKYRPMQCHTIGNQCWCVDEWGREIPGTRKPPGTDQLHCETPATRRPKTACEDQRDRVNVEYSSYGARPSVGFFAPECDDEGKFRPLQCHSSIGQCWCVNERGEEIPGTRTFPGADQPRCGLPEPTTSPQTLCERWREMSENSRTSADQYIPQCDDYGNFRPMQCRGDRVCWCVGKDGREIQGTGTQTGILPACIPTVAPPTVQSTPSSLVTPPSTGTFLLYAQGQHIGYLPLNGTQLNKEGAKSLLALHGSIVIGIDYDCREKMVYWTDVAGRTINRISLEIGAEPEIVINSGLTSPEGLTIDYLRRRMFWTDSGSDKIEVAGVDGSHRRVLFDTNLVNPRAIVVDSLSGNLYWTDWNREAPKIEMSYIDGTNRRVLVKDDIGLPNGLTFDPFSLQLCWADAGTKNLECIFSDGTGRRVVQLGLNYPFSIVAYSNHFYYTDWRRDGVIVVNKANGRTTDEFLPDQRSHLYGITVAYPSCPHELHDFLNNIFPPFWQEENNTLLVTSLDARYIWRKRVFLSRVLQTD